eukprot:4203395-Karenia_brevis.AAC.1
MRILCQDPQRVPRLSQFLHKNNAYPMRGTSPGTAPKRILCEGPQRVLRLSRCHRKNHAYPMRGTATCRCLIRFHRKNPRASHVRGLLE